MLHWHRKKEVTQQARKITTCANLDGLAFSFSFLFCQNCLLRLCESVTSLFVLYLLKLFIRPKLTEFWAGDNRAPSDIKKGDTAGRIFTNHFYRWLHLVEL